MSTREAAAFKIESIHQIHGHQCLCGFKSAVSRDRTRHIVDATLDATLPRTITTIEELDALQSGSVILDSEGEPNILHDNGWVLPGGDGGYTTWAVAQSLPATVLFESEAQA